MTHLLAFPGSGQGLAEGHRQEACTNCRQLTSWLDYNAAHRLIVSSSCMCLPSEWKSIRCHADEKHAQSQCGECLFFWGGGGGLHLNLKLLARLRALSEGTMGYGWQVLDNLEPISLVAIWIQVVQSADIAVDCIVADATTV